MRVSNGLQLEIDSRCDSRTGSIFWIQIMALNHKQLVGLQRAEFNKAALLQARILYVQIAIACMAAAAVYVPSETVTYLTALAAVLLSVFWVWLQLSYRESRSQAERARRATLLMDGLGEDISASQLRDIEKRFTVSKAEGLQHEDANYYAAEAEPGDKRLAEMLEEGAFWSEDLSRHSARQTWIAFAVFLCLGLFLLFGSMPFVPKDQLQGAVRVFCAILTLLVSSDILGAAFAYDRASRSLGILMQRLETLRAAGYPKADLLLLLTDYNSAVECAPMWVPGIYDKRRNDLNALWDRRIANADNDNVSKG